MADGQGHLRRDGLNGRRPGVQVLHGHGHGAVPVEGHAAGEHLVEHHAHGVNVAGHIGGLAAGLLRAEIMHRAHHRIAAGEGGAVGHAGDAEVRHLDVPVLMDEDILRLDVPVDDAVLMGMLQRREDPDGDLRRHGGVDAPLLPDDLLEGLALDVLHHQVAVVPVHAHVQKVDDIVVGHAAGGLRLPLEAADELRVLVELGLKHLHRHAVPRALIDGAVNNGHAAHADLLHQAVAVSQYFLAHRLPSLSWRSTTVTLS